MPNVLSGLFTVLSSFFENKRPISYKGTSVNGASVGGGGQDNESAEYAIRALRLLSSCDDDNAGQCLRGIFRICESNIQALKTHEGLSKSAKEDVCQVTENMERHNIATTTSSVLKEPAAIFNTVISPVVVPQSTNSVQSVMTHLSTDTFSDSTDGPTTFDKIWEVIVLPKNLNDDFNPEDLTSYMTAMGLYDSSKLQFCTTDIFCEIKSF